MTLLSIAGFDPSGGAGILNDIKTFHALNEYGTAAITALTSQNAKRVEDINPVAIEFIQSQIDLILDEEKIVYGKTGMLYSPEIVKAVAEKVDEYRLKMVVDPVMIAGSGGLLSKNNLVKALKEHLLPLATLTTPNIYEAQELSGVKIRDEENARKAASKIGEICDVVITGGHLKGNDLLYNGSIKILKGELLESGNTHGSGCTFSAACTAYLNKDLPLEKAVIKAGIFTKKGIKYGLKGTLDQFWECKRNIKKKM
jgi:hydroxymethylpyrimidine/phosphomethylpyrimidine kinase